MIYGVGIDLVEISRIKKNFNDKFIKRVLTSNEIKILNTFESDKRKLEFLSGRFSAKEAFVKALGTGIGDVSFQDIEILSDNGKPTCIYPGFKVNLSITHTNEYANAIVILEKHNG